MLKNDNIAYVWIYLSNDEKEGEKNEMHWSQTEIKPRF